MSKRQILTGLKTGLGLYVDPFLKEVALTLTQRHNHESCSELAPFVELVLLCYSKALTSPKPPPVDTRGHHSWPALPRAS